MHFGIGVYGVRPTCMYEYDPEDCACVFSRTDPCTSHYKGLDVTAKTLH